MRRYLLLFLLALPYAISGFISARYSVVVGDEGWYLMAICNVLEGKKPYADFLYTQTPLLPYCYGTVMAFTGPSIEAGRWISYGFGLAATVLIILL